MCVLLIAVKPGHGGRGRTSRRVVELLVCNNVRKEGENTMKGKRNMPVSPRP